MAVTRARAKGRRGGEGERFAYLPESVLQSDAVRTLPHAAFKVLAILLVGRTRERNGTACCSDSYAARYGIMSHDTVRRALEELQARGLIVATRRVSRFKRHPTLYGVTWWPLVYRDGEVLTVPEPASHAYANWQPFTPTSGVTREANENNCSPRPAGDITPISGVNAGSHHPDGVVKTAIHHPDQRGQSLDLGRGARSTRRRRDVQSASVDLAGKVRRLIASAPHLTDRDIAHTLRQYSIDAAQVAAIRAGGAP